MFQYPPDKQAVFLPTCFYNEYRKVRRADLTEEKQKKKKRHVHPAQAIALSVLAAIAVGTVLLMLPCMTRDGRGLPPVKAIFTAVSSVCVTGLTLIDPAVTLSRYGQAVLLVLIEIGGISMVTFASFFIFSFKKRSALRSVRLAQEYTNLDVLSQVKPLVKTIIGCAVICQLSGTVLLCLRFVPRMGAKGIWVSLFTAVSAYCNAGFDLFGVEKEFGSFCNYNSDPFVMGVVMAMIILGGIGFFVFYDIFNFRKSRRISLHTKTVLITAAILIILGFACVFVFEYNNPATLGPLSFGEKITASLFQSVTTRTAGFASLDIASLHDVTKMVMMLLMFIGAGSGSTGGGIKITTFAVLVMTVVSVLKSRKETVVLKKRVNQAVVAKSLAIAVLSLLIVFAVTCVLSWDTPSANGTDLFFEAVSGFSTCGLTSGITAQVGNAGLWALIFSMYVGRIGPMCFVIALNSKKGEDEAVIIPEGRIMVG